MNPTKAQELFSKSKILFIVDASGSMQADWGNEKKFDVAKRVLFELVDSIQKTNPNVEIGIRVFGHQSHKSKNDCKDSKLEVHFGFNNGEKVYQVFDRIKAQGNTPIAYSLIEAAKDFSEDMDAINSIILITDGLENCKGNPCEATLDLKKKRITINPYIIGLDIESSLIKDFECIGTFVNARDAETFSKVLEIAVKTVTKTTTVEINLLSKENKLISNTPITFYNHYTKEVVYNFIHSLDKFGKADTIRLDPRGVFDVVVHTFPTILIEKIELQAGIHNKINVPLLKGKLDFNYAKVYDDNKIDYVLRHLNSENIIYNHGVKDYYFVSGKYNLTVLTIPFIEESSKNIPVERGVHQFIKPNGKLSIDIQDNIRASLFLKMDSKLILVKDFGVIESKLDIKLQPGKYKLVFIRTDAFHSDRTIVKNFEIFEGKTVLIK